METAEGSARWDGELMPREGVGPLGFGLRITEVTAVLPGLRGYQASLFGGACDSQCCQA